MYVKADITSDNPDLQASLNACNNFTKASITYTLSLIHIWINPAKEYILSALKAGKHVVSANKDLIAVHGHELLDAAHELSLIHI